MCSDWSITNREFHISGNPFNNPTHGNLKTSLLPLKWIEYGVYGDLVIFFPQAIFYLLKGDYTSTKRPLVLANIPK